MPPLLLPMLMLLFRILSSATTTTKEYDPEFIIYERKKVANLIFCV